MATTYTGRVPTWFWIVSGVALLWSLMGVGAYLQQAMMTPDDIAAFPDAQRALYETTPAWVTGAFAFAVFGGTVGAVGLLLRRAWAGLAFIVSLLGALVQFGWVFAVAKAHETIGPSAIPFPATIIVIGVALIWFASIAAKRGWLR